MSDLSMTRDAAAKEDVERMRRPAIPGFEILEELGRGGMGVVFKALQISSQRLTALKVIRDGALAGPAEQARFRIEAEAAARMRHPNIAEILEVGEHHGRPYYAMELVEQGSLDKHVGRPLGAELAGQLVRTLALAVEHAHARSIVHRDLKPANILLASHGVVSGEWSKDTVAAAHSPLALLQPKIADFGLAKRLDSESTAWTQVGAVIGTAAYMAPEQAAGRSDEIGPAVDIYALGAIFYELLTGRPPFQAANWAQTIEQVLHDEPAPPTQLISHIPGDLETICLKCLEKEPGRRYPTANELANDLERFLAGRSIVARPLDQWERLARLAARDGYQIEEEIGRGPASVVYRAQYLPLNQPAAVKVFQAGDCSREAWEDRLRRGADLSAALAHPHIVPVQRTGWWDAAPYVAVEYVPQGSLAPSLKGRPYVVSQALRLVAQLAETMIFVHRQGIAHGNLKPSNILLAADGIPRVADFHPTGGLWCASLPPEGDAPPGLAYLAPELVENPAAEPRPNTDVYGLAIVLYALLTGQPPFEGATTDEVLTQVRLHVPIAPSRYNSQVSPSLDVLCLRCLRKNPWRRYSRVFDLLKQLRRLQETPSGVASPTQRRQPRSSRDDRR